MYRLLLAGAAAEFTLLAMCSHRLAALVLFVAPFVAATAQNFPPGQASRDQSGVAAPPPGPTAGRADQPILRLRPGTEAAAVAAANRMFARLLDSVGLYTIIGGLKPMSDIMAWDDRRPFNLEEDLKRRPDYEAALAPVESDLIKARVLWGTANRGKSGGLFVFRTDLVRETILAHEQVFRRERIAPDVQVETLMQRLETRAFHDLSRVQGLLYGFPPYAVEFFCHAFTTGKPTGVGKDRKGVAIPCYASRSDFIYVIPIANELAPEDLEIQRQAALILAEYRQRRPRYELAHGEIAALSLINDWHRDIAEGKSSVVNKRIPSTVAAMPRKANDGSASVMPPAEQSRAPVQSASPLSTEELERIKDAAGKGNAGAQFRLAGIFASGRGAPRDLEMAAKYYRLAAISGMARAQVFLALAYLQGRGLPQDPAAALKWLRQAAEQGHSGAYYYLGTLYAQGQGVPKDATEAAKWYRLAAADTNDPFTVMPQYYLGQMYATGNGVPKDTAESTRWYRIAAERGYRAAQRALGQLYLNGNGVPKDAVEGLAWITVAADSGTEATKLQKADLESRLSPEVITQAQQRSRELAAQVSRNRKGMPSPPD